MEKLNLDNEVHPLSLGKSFEKRSGTAFHSIRYDFKPASVDTSQVSSVITGENSSVSVSVPHVEGSGTSHTVYKGNKRPSPKECVLIIDHRTGEFTLEKLANMIQLKKTRLEGRSKIRPTTPVEHHPKPKDVKQSPVKKVSAQPYNPTPPPVQPTPPVTLSSQGAGSPDVSSESSSGSSDSSDSDDEEDVQKPSEKVHPAETNETRESSMPPIFHSTLSEDLRLSESGSDSD